MHNIGIEPITSKLKVLRSTKWANYEVSYFMTIRFFDGNRGIEPRFQAGNA